MSGDSQAAASATRNRAVIVLLVGLLGSDVVPAAIGFVSGVQSGVPYADPGVRYFVGRVVLAFGPLGRALMLSLALFPLWRLSAGSGSALRIATRFAFAVSTAIVWARAIRRLWQWDHPARLPALELVSWAAECGGLVLAVLTVASYAKRADAKLSGGLVAGAVFAIVLELGHDVTLTLVDLPLAPSALLAVGLATQGTKWILVILVCVIARTGTR